MNKIIVEKLMYEVDEEKTLTFVKSCTNSETLQYSIVTDKSEKLFIEA